MSMREFEERKNQEYPDRDPLDEEVLRFVKSWHRHPALHDLLWYRGVNLGEVDEYTLIPEVLTALVEREAKQDA